MNRVSGRIFIPHTKKNGLMTSLPNNPMLNIRLNIKTIAPERESKVGKCYATAYAFLRLRYKFEVEKLSFCKIYFPRKIGVPEFDRNMFIAQSKYDLKRILCELVFIPQM